LPEFTPLYFSSQYLWQYFSPQVY